MLWGVQNQLALLLLGFEGLPAAFPPRHFMRANNLKLFMLVDCDRGLTSILVRGQKKGVGRTSSPKCRRRLHAAAALLTTHWRFWHKCWRTEPMNVFAGR